MRWQIYGILVIFALFVIALIFNPNLSCFGKKLKSPFYPILRKRRRKLKTYDYGFSLGDKKAKVKTKEKMQKLGTKDYSFSLDEDDIKKTSEEEKE